MRSTAVLCACLAFGACAQPELISLDDIRDARGELPGFSTVINCSNAPKIIFDKHGEIVEMIHPIRHPSCSEKVTKRDRARSRVILESTDKSSPVRATPEPTPIEQTSAEPLTPKVPNLRPTTPVAPILPVACNDPDDCHDHPDHDPLTHDNALEQRTIHGIVPVAGG